MPADDVPPAAADEAPDLDRMIGLAGPGQARRFAFRVARLACAVTGVLDEVALTIAREGLDHLAEVDELVHLWEVERELEATCAERIAADPTSTPSRLRLHHECLEARAVSAVIAALKPDAFVAARAATEDARAAGCAEADLVGAADGLLSD